MHAISGGVTLLEFQQNREITYRPYDYGRSASCTSRMRWLWPTQSPATVGITKRVAAEEPAILADGPHFSLVHGMRGRAPAEALTGRRRWVMPLEGTVVAGAYV